MLRRQPENWSSKHWSYFILTFAEAVATYMTMQRPQQHFIDVLKDNKNMQNYNSSFLLEKNSPYLWVGFFPPPRQIILHQLQIFMPFLPEPRHQVRQPTSFDKRGSSCHPEIHTGTRLLQTRYSDRTLHFVGTVCLYPCVLKCNSLAFGTGNTHAFRNKILAFAHRYRKEPFFRQ